MPLRFRHTLVAVFALALTSCTSAPTLPSANDPDAVHALVVGSKGADFLLDTSTYEWPDGGAQPAKLFDWVPNGATSTDPAQATRAGETAQALATFLASHEHDLLEISTNLFGRDKTVGELNPQLVKSYAAALIPFQGAFVCDQAPRGFDWHANDCSAAVSQARPVFTVLNTDSESAKAFAAAATALTDTYLTRFAAGVVDPSKLFDQGPTLSGTLLGLVYVGAQKSGIQIDSIQDLENRADYLLAYALIPAGTNPGLPPQYFADGKLLSPDAVEKNLGAGELAAYYASFRTYLGTRGGLQTRLSANLRDAYYTVTGT